jgi:hypothetical protein
LQLIDGFFSLSVALPFTTYANALKASNPNPFEDTRRSRYGNLFKTHLFGKPTIFSTDPEVNKFIL